MDITVGMLVYSKAGRDKKNLFLVLEVENGYAYIADGNLRKSEKPKKKKLIHLQKTKHLTFCLFSYHFDVSHLILWLVL